MIRPLEHGDAEGAVALLRALEPTWINTVGGLLHRMASEPQRAHRRTWVAVEENRIVGWGMARLDWAIETEGVGSLHVGVEDRFRGAGIGSRLYEHAERHLLEHGARLLETSTDKDPGRRFLERRGFSRTRSERLWSLDPRTVDLSALPRLEREREREGFRVAALSELASRVDDLYPLWAEAVADMPADEPETNISFEEWKQGEMAHPELSWEGSFVALHGDLPVSFAWLHVDLAERKAEHEGTGTLRAFRRRGLARLVKLATIRWSLEHGITQMVTGNDSTNADMLALNEHLGYRPLPPEDRYAKRV